MLPSYGIRQFPTRLGGKKFLSMTGRLLKYGYHGIWSGHQSGLGGVVPVPSGSGVTGVARSVAGVARSPVGGEDGSAGGGDARGCGGGVVTAPGVADGVLLI